MSWGFVATAAATVVGSAISSDAQRSAANKARDAQNRSSDAAIAEQQRQFDAIQKLLQPYVSAGTGALTAQQNLIGLGGEQAQRSAISALQGSPEFAALTQQGENAILANASATGGLRGGNVQGALAQFRPQVLSGLINQQYERLGGLTSVGQNAAAGVGNAGMQTGSSIANLLTQQGAANAGAALAAGRGNAQWGNVIGQLGGMWAGRYGGFGASLMPSEGDGPVMPSEGAGVVSGGSGIKFAGGF